MWPIIKNILLGEATQLILGALLVFAVVLEITNGDVNLGIYAAVFIVVSVFFCMSLINVFLAYEKEKEEKGKNGYFSGKVILLIGNAIGVLFVTWIIGGVISHIFVDYCVKDSWMYSERHCALQDAEEKVLSNYKSYSYE